MPEPEINAGPQPHLCLFSSAVVRTSWGPTKIGSLARLSVKPECLTGEGDHVALLGVTASTSDTLTVAVVDVVIDMQSIAGDENAEPLPIHLVCAADLLFSTTEGLVRADQLAGKTIHRVLADETLDTFTVPEVSPVEFVEPAPVFGVLVDVDPTTLCVGSDATVAAIVFPTL
jgi:hypothetical protein